MKLSAAFLLFCNEWPYDSVNSPMMCRYERWLPELPDVPLVINSSVSNPCRRQFNVSSLHYFDSSRFIVSLFDVDDLRAEHGRRTFRSPRSQLRRKTNKSNVKSRASSTTTSTDAAVADLDCFRLIFVAIDVAIVAFHLSRGYIDLQRLQRCCRCRCHDTSFDPCALRNGSLTTNTDPVEDRAGLGRLLPSDGVVPTVYNDAATATKTSTTANDYVAVHEPESDMAMSRRQRSTEVLQRQRRQFSVVARTTYVVARTTMILVGRIVRSRSILPLLACAFVLAATHCVVRTCSRLPASHLTLSTGTLASVFATTVRFQTATANAYLSEDTRHLDSAVLRLASGSMTQDLHNLLSIVNNFRHGLNVSRTLYR